VFARAAGGATSLVPEETAASVKTTMTIKVRDAPMTTSSLKNGRRQDVDRTRGQLDDTLKELTYKIVVPASVRDKVHNPKKTVQVKAEAVRQQEHATAEAVTQQEHATAEAVTQQEQATAEAVTQQEQATAEAVTQQEQATAEAVTQQEQATAEAVTQQEHVGAEAVQAAAGEAAWQVEGLADQVRENVPPQVVARVEPLMVTAPQRPLPTAAIAVGVLVVLMVLRLVLRRLLVGTADGHTDAVV
jgi:regulator of protease activity HflC (stomatin/prohibitin superfamily)